jgi:tetratricopeptide (TPR) repeat protein
MNSTTQVTDLSLLFRYNRSIPCSTTVAFVEKIEQSWIVPMLATIEADAPALTSRAEWIQALDDLLARERTGSAAADYLAESATREVFTAMVAQFALDGLTEAQNFFPAVARLPIQAQMPVMRVPIDEFGCGNINQAHSQLYRNLLSELGLPLDLDSYLEGTSDETYAFLNVFYWLAQRAPHVEYFLGALAYLEASIPTAFAYYARACERLGIENSQYYTEHIHIDNFHMKEMQLAIREYEKAHGLDPTRVWVGACLLSEILSTAFEAAVQRARALAGTV